MSWKCLPVPARLIFSIVFARAFPDSLCGGESLSNSLSNCCHYAVRVCSGDALSNCCRYTVRIGSGDALSNSFHDALWDCSDDALSHCCRYALPLSLYDTLWDTSGDFLSLRKPVADPLGFRHHLIQR